MNRRLVVKLTKEERSFYSNLFSTAVKEGDTRLEGKEGASFLKKFGLSKEVLKNIWMISAQTNLSWLEREEFYIALRLIALAQNNMPFDENSILLNEPIPPLPKIDLKVNKQEVEEASTIDWDINFDQYSNYERIFERFKEKNNPNLVSFQSSYTIFSNSNINQDAVGKSIQVVGLSNPAEGFTKNELIIILHLLNKSKSDPSKIPSVLPNSLKALKTQNEINMAQNNSKIPAIVIEDRQEQKKKPNTSLDDLLQSEIMKLGYANAGNQPQYPGMMNFPDNKVNQNIQSQQAKPANNMRGSEIFNREDPTQESYYQNNQNNCYLPGSTNQSFIDQSSAFMMNSNPNPLQNPISVPQPQSQNSNIMYQQNPPQPSYNQTQIGNNTSFNAQNCKRLEEQVGSNLETMTKLTNQLASNSERDVRLKNEDIFYLQQQLEQEMSLLNKLKQILDNSVNDSQKLDRQIQEVKTQIVETKRQTNITLDSINKLEQEKRMKAQQLSSLKGMFNCIKISR